MNTHVAQELACALSKGVYIFENFCTSGTHPHSTPAGLGRDLLSCAHRPCSSNSSQRFPFRTTALGCQMLSKCGLFVRLRRWSRRAVAMWSKRGLKKGGVWHERRRHVLGCGHRKSVGDIDGIRAEPRIGMQLAQQRQTAASQRARSLS